MMKCLDSDNSPERWNLKYVTILLSMISITALLIIVFSLCFNNNEFSLPSYEKFQEKQRIMQERREQKMNQQRQEQLRVEESIKRQQEEEQRRQAEMLEEESFDDTDISVEDVLEQESSIDERVEELLEGLE